MKISLLAVLLAAMTCIVSAQLENSKREALNALREGKIAMLVLEKATFEEALNQVQQEWSKQHPNWPFPVGTTDYNPPDVMRHEQPPLVSFKVKDVSFITALRYLGDATKRRLSASPGLLRMEEVAWIEEDYYTKSYPMSEKLLKTLGLSSTSTQAEIEETYKPYGVHLGDWMRLRIVDGSIEILGYDREHQQIAGINVLLDNGFKIIKEPNKPEMATPRKPSD
ncbi:hypothetical protein [Luteolibacter sp. AS25]|uniref:hypothetical protein n=1 Tax=Luteolibacter sp. AS25 TaxID=3135776 RepID=UPI00398B8B2C